MIGKRFAAHALTMCGYRPRVRMPLFSYFAVVTPCLIGVLFIAPAAYAPPPPMRVAAPIRLPGSEIRVVDTSMPILTIREAPVPPAWALTSTEPQIMARQIEPRKHPGAKIVKVQNSTPNRPMQTRRGGKAYAAAGPFYYDAGRIW